MFHKIRQGNIKDHYHFDQRIGEGSLGVVYQARHRVTLQKVAIKAIVNIDFDMHGRFIDEVSVLMRLDHPNISKILDIWQWDKIIFLVMEFHKGGQLAQCLAKRG